MWYMSNYAWWYCSFSFSCSNHFQWPWPYLGHSVSNSLNWKMYVLIQLNWNSVGLFSMSSRPWIHHFLLLFSFSTFANILKRDNWHISSFEKKNYIGFLSDTIKSKIFQTFYDYNLTQGLHCHSKHFDFDLVSRSQACWKLKLKLVFFRFLSTVV